MEQIYQKSNSIFELTSHIGIITMSQQKNIDIISRIDEIIEELTRIACTLHHNCATGTYISSFTISF